MYLHPPTQGHYNPPAAENTQKKPENRGGAEHTFHRHGLGFAEFPKLLNQMKREEALLKTKGGKDSTTLGCGGRDGRRRRRRKKNAEGKFLERQFEKWDIFRRWLFFGDQYGVPKIPPTITNLGVIGIYTYTHIYTHTHTHAYVCIYVYILLYLYTCSTVYLDMLYPKHVHY